LDEDDTGLLDLIDLDVDPDMSLPDGCSTAADEPVVGEPLVSGKADIVFVGCCTLAGFTGGFDGPGLTAVVFGDAVLGGVTSAGVFTGAAFGVVFWTGVG